MDTGGGNDQIAHARKSGEGLRQTAELHAETCHFRKAAGNDCGPGIVAIAKTMRDARCQRNDIFQSTAEFNTFYIGIGIDTHYRVGEDALHLFRQRDIRTGGDDRGRKIFCDFLRMGRAGQCDHPCLRDLGVNHFTHRHQGIGFDSLCDIRNDLPFLYIRRKFAGGASYKDRGHRKEIQCVFITDFFRFIGKENFLRNFHIREILLSAGRFKLFNFFRQRGPYFYFVSASAQHSCQCHAPGAGTDHIDFCHNTLLMSPICGNIQEYDKPISSDGTGNCSQAHCQSTGLRSWDSHIPG